MTQQNFSKSFSFGSSRKAKEERRRRAKANAKNTRDRQRLAQYEGRQVSCLATFVTTGHVRFGAIGGDGRTALLKNVRFPDGRPLCDHIWVRFSEVQNLDALVALRPGDAVLLRGTAYRYFAETGRAVIAAKYGLKEIVFEAAA